LNRPAEPGMSAPYSGAAVGRLEWIRNRNGIQVQFQPVSGGSSDPQPVTRIELKAEQLDPQMRAMVTDALATLQTFDLIASRGVTTRREPRNGIENEVI